MQNIPIYDLIIIGAGPAGITAGVYAARKRMSLLILTGNIGGQTILTWDIQNYTGYQFISGTDLTQKLEDHTKQYGLDVRQDEEVTGIEKQGGEILVTSAKGSYRARTVIVASGKKSRELSVSGEKEFRNKGVTYCATCDGPLFAGKDVAVIGGGNSALESVLQLTKIANKVYVINITPELGGDAILREKVESAGNVTIKNSTQVKAIKGEKFVGSILVESQGEEEEINVQGVFVEIGLIPNTGFESDIKKNEVGEIEVTKRNETSVPGIFAAGDVTDIPEKQIIVAAGEGAKAALSAFAYITKTKEEW
jgi:alkyl hydroperoxide reductase subunit F